MTEYANPEDDPDVQEAAKAALPPDPGDSGEDHDLSPEVDDSDDSRFDDGDAADDDVDSDDADGEPSQLLDVEEGEG